MQPFIKKIMPPKNKDVEEGIATRCSPKHFRKVMDELEKKMTRAQRAAIMATPFYHLTRLPRENSSTNRLEAILSLLDVNTRAFVFGEGVVLPFPSWEFACVLGLRHAGQDVHPKLVEESRIVAKHFGGKVGHVNRSAIERKLKGMVGEKATDDKEFAGLFVLLVFNCILFPMGHLYTPAHVVHYVDNVDDIGSYAWGKAVYRFLWTSLVDYKAGRKRYVDGCTMGLMVSIVFLYAIYFSP